MSGLSALDLKARVLNFEHSARLIAEKSAQKAEKERVIQERVEAKRRAHEEAVAELRLRQAEDAEKVRFAFSGSGPLRAVALGATCSPTAR
jgi:hypothetical protein